MTRNTKQKVLDITIVGIIVIAIVLLTLSTPASGYFEVRGPDDPPRKDDILAGYVVSGKEVCRLYDNRRSLMRVCQTFETEEKALEAFKYLSELEKLNDN